MSTKFKAQFLFLAVITVTLAACIVPVRKLPAATSSISPMASIEAAATASSISPVAGTEAMATMPAPRSADELGLTNLGNGIYELGGIRWNEKDLTVGDMKVAVNPATASKLRMAFLEWIYIFRLGGDQIKPTHRFVTGFEVFLRLVNADSSRGWQGMYTVDGSKSGIPGLVTAKAIDGTVSLRVIGARIVDQQTALAEKFIPMPGGLMMAVSVVDGAQGEKIFQFSLAPYTADNPASIGDFSADQPLAQRLAILNRLGQVFLYCAEKEADFAVPNDLVSGSAELTLLGKTISGGGVPGGLSANDPIFVALK